MFCNSAPPSLIPIVKVPVKLPELQIQCPIVGRGGKIEKIFFFNVLLNFKFGYSVLGPSGELNFVNCEMTKIG